MSIVVDLPGAVRAEQRDDLARRDHEVDAAHCMDRACGRAKALFDAVQSDGVCFDRHASMVQLHMHQTPVPSVTDEA